MTLGARNNVTFFGHFKIRRHMDPFTLVDTFRVLSPQAAPNFTKTVKERISEPIEIHCHSDFGMS